MTLDYTVAVVCDSHYLRHFRWTSQTWRKFRSTLFARPWVVVYDCNMSFTEIDELISIAPKGTQFQHWPPAGIWYSTQREKMLSAWLFMVPDLVRTPWYSKIDSDAFAERESDNWEFENYSSGEDVAIFPSWGYSKPAEYVTTVQDWGDQHPFLQHFPRLPLKVVPGQETCKGKRFASWVGLYNTHFSRQVAHYCEPFKAPVPSEDTTKWLICERLGKKWSHYPAKSHGWSNIRNAARSEARCRELLAIEPCSVP